MLSSPTRRIANRSIIAVRSVRDLLPIIRTRSPSRSSLSEFARNAKARFELRTHRDELDERSEHVSEEIVALVAAIEAHFLA